MATVTFIRYKSQSAGALHGVAGYVSQKQKTEQEDGWQLVKGQNCTPQLAAQEFIAGSAGGAGYYIVTNAFGVRPVINLAPDTPITKGIGTQNDPYIVKIA